MQRRGRVAGKGLFPYSNELTSSTETLGGQGRSIIVIVIVVIIVVVVIVVVIILVFAFLVGPLALLGLGDLVGQFRGPHGPHQGLFLLDQAFLPQPEQALVHQEHAVLAAGLDRGVDA